MANVGHQRGHRRYRFRQLTGNELPSTPKLIHETLPTQIPHLPQHPTLLPQSRRHILLHWWSIRHDTRAVWIGEPVQLVVL